MKKSLVLFLCLLLFALPLCSAQASVSLPSGLKAIEQEAFEGNSAFTGVVELPGGIRSVGNRAFKNTNIFGLKLPAAIRDVGEGILESSGSTYAIVGNASPALAASAFKDIDLLVGKPGGTVENWAGDNDIPFFSMDSLFYKDGFAYMLIEGTTSMMLAFPSEDHSGSVKIPASVYGADLVGVMPYAFTNLKNVTAISLPDIAANNMPDSPKAWPSAEITFYGTDVENIVYPPEKTEHPEDTMELAMAPQGRITLSVGETIRPDIIDPPLSTWRNYCTWTSSNTKVLTVDATGLVTAVGEGTAAVTATVRVFNPNEYATPGEPAPEFVYYAVSHFNVGANTPAVDIYENALDLTVGQVYYPSIRAVANSTLETVVLSFEYEDSLGRTQDSHEPPVAAVSLYNKEMMISALTPGKATITLTAEFEGTTVTDSITVKVAEPKLDMNFDTLLTYTGYQYNLRPENELPAGAALSYASEDSSIASVDANGHVTIGSKTGETVITVTAAYADGKTASAEIPVRVKPWIAFTEAYDRELYADWNYHKYWEDLQPELICDLWPHDAEFLNIWAESADDNIVDFGYEYYAGYDEELYVAHAKYIGETDVTYYAELDIPAGEDSIPPYTTTESTFHVTVVLPDDMAVYLTEGWIEMSLGEVYGLDMWWEGGTAIQHAYLYSDNPEIAAIDSTGEITARGEGMTTIHAVIEAWGATYEATCTVVVNGWEARFEPEEIWLNVGESAYIVPHIELAANGKEGMPDNHRTSYRAHNEEIAAITDAGLITALTPGTTVVDMEAFVYNNDVQPKSADDMTFEGHDNYSRVRAYCVVHVVDPDPAITFKSDILEVYPRVPVQLHAYDAKGNELNNVVWSVPEFLGDWRGIVSEGGELWMNQATSDDSEYFYVRATAAVGGKEVSAIQTIVTKERPAVIEGMFLYNDIDVGAKVKVHHAIRTSSSDAKYTLDFVSDDPSIAEALIEDGELYVRGVADGTTTLRAKLYDENGELCNAYPMPVFINTAEPAPDANTTIAFEYPTYFFSTYDDYNDTWPQVIVEPEMLRDYYPITFGSAEKSLIRIDEDGHLRHRYTPGTAEITAQIGDFVGVKDPMAKAKVIIADATVTAKGMCADGTVVEPNEWNDLYITQGDELVIDLVNFPAFDNTGIIPEEYEIYVHDPDLMRITDRSKDGKTVTLTALQSGWTDVDVVVNLGSWEQMYRFGVEIREPEVDFRFDVGSMIPMSIGEKIYIWPEFDWYKVTSVKSTNAKVVKASINKSTAEGEAPVILEALKAGRETITAVVQLNEEGDTATVTLEVLSVAEAWDLVDFGNIPTTMVVGDKYPGHPYVQNSGFIWPELTFASSNPELLEIEEPCEENDWNYYLVPRKAGVVTLTITASKGATNQKVIFGDILITEPGLKMTPNDIHLRPGAYETLTLQANTSTPVTKIVWSTDDAGIAEVIADGDLDYSVQVKAHENANIDNRTLVKAQVYFPNGNYSYAAAWANIITDRDAYFDAWLYEDYREIFMGESFTIERDWNGNSPLTHEYFASSDPSVATVSATGVVSPRKPGETTITYTAESYGTMDTAYMTVRVLGYEASLNATELNMAVGESAYLVPTIVGGEPDSNHTHFFSANERVAHVDGIGCVTAVAPGSTTVGYETEVYGERVVLYCDVNVVSGETQKLMIGTGEGSAFEPLTAVTLHPREEMWLTAKVDGNLEGELEWNTTDENFVLVDGGFIKCMQRELWDPQRSFTVISVSGMIDGKLETAYLTVEVLPSVVNIDRSPNYYEIGVGESTMMEYTINKTDPDMVVNTEFLIQNMEGETKTIATVNHLGEITGVSEGMCMVRLNLRGEDGALLASGAAYVYVGRPIPCPTDEDVFFDFEYDLYSFYPCGNESIGLGDRYLRTRLVGKDGYYNADHLLTHGYELVYESSDPDHLEIFDDGNMHIWEDWWTGEVTISAYFRGYEDGPRAEATVKVTSGEPHVLITTPDGETIRGKLGLDGVNEVPIGSKITVTFADISGMDNVTAEMVEKEDIATCFGDAPIEWTEWDFDDNALQMAFESNHTASFYLRGDWYNNIWIDAHVAPENERFDHFVQIQPIGSRPMFNRVYVRAVPGEEIDNWPAFDWWDLDSVSVGDDSVIELVDNDECPFRVRAVGLGKTELTALIGLPYDHDAGEEQEFVSISCVIEVVEDDWGLVSLDRFPNVMFVGDVCDADPDWYRSGLYWPELHVESSDEDILGVTFREDGPPLLEAWNPGKVTVTVYAWKGDFDEAMANGGMQMLQKDIVVTNPTVRFGETHIELRPGAAKHIPLLINLPESQMSGAKVAFVSDDPNLATAEFAPYTFGDGTAVPGVVVSGVGDYNDCRVQATVTMADGTVHGATMYVDIIPDWEVWVDAYNWYTEDSDGIWLSTNELAAYPMSDVVWQSWEHNASHFDEPHKGAGTDKAWIEWEIEDENIAYFDGFYEREGDNEMNSGIAPWNNGPIIHAKNFGDTVIRTHLVLTNENGDFLAEDWDEIWVHVMEPEIDVWFHEDYHEVEVGREITVGWEQLYEGSIEPTGTKVYTDDPDIAYFGNYGRIFGVNPGETTAHVEMMVGGNVYEDTATIVVYGPEFSLENESLTIAAGEAINPGVRLNLNGYSASDIEYVSSNPDVAQVMPDCSIVGLSEGQTTVVYWIDVEGIGLIHRYCDVTVTGNAPEYALDHSAMTLYPEQTARLLVTTTGNDAIREGSMVWSSSDEGIVSVDDEGNITTCRYNDIQHMKRTVRITCDAETVSGKPVSMSCTVTVLPANVIIWERQFGDGRWEGRGVDEWFGMYEWYELLDPTLTAEYAVTIDDPSIVEYADGSFHTLKPGHTFAHYTVTASNGETYTRDLMIRVEEDTMPERIYPEFDMFVVHREWNQHYLPLIVEPDYTGVMLHHRTDNNDILGFDEGIEIGEMYFHGDTGLCTVHVHCPENEALDCTADVLVIGDDNDFYFAATQDGRDVETDENGVPTFAPGESFELDLRNIYDLDLPEGTIEHIEYRNYYGDDQFTVTDDGTVTITQAWDEMEETKNLWATVYFKGGLEISICLSFYVDATNEPFFFLSTGDAYDPRPFTIAPGSGVAVRFITNREWSSKTYTYHISDTSVVSFNGFHEDSDELHLYGEGDGEAILTVTLPEANLTASFRVIVETPTSVDTLMGSSSETGILYVGEEIELYTGERREWENEERINFDRWHRYTVDKPAVADIVENIVGEENAGERDWMTLRALSEGTVTVTSTAGYQNFPELGTDVKTMTFHVIPRTIFIGMHAYADVTEGGTVHLPITLFCGRDEYAELSVESANKNIATAELSFDEAGNPYAKITGVNASGDTEVYVTAKLADGREQTITVTVKMHAAGSRIAIMTGSHSQSIEEITAATIFQRVHGEEKVMLDTYPDDFIRETDETIGKIVNFGWDPAVGAIIVCQGVPGVSTGMSTVRENCEEEGREAPLMIMGVPQEDPAVTSRAADFLLVGDEIGQADTIAETLVKWDCDVLIHYSFPRHMAMETIAARYDLLAANCESVGIDLVNVTIPDPTANGVEFARDYLTEDVAKQMQTYAGKKVAFFCTNCGMQSALQSAVLNYDNAYYPQPCCPSPYHGFQESLDLDLTLGSESDALEKIARALNAHGAAGRFSTWPSPVNMTIIYAAGEYALGYTDGSIESRSDVGAMKDVISQLLPGATINSVPGYDNYLTLLLKPVDFNDYL